MVYLMSTGTQTLPQISIFINSIGISLQPFEKNLYSTAFSLLHTICNLHLILCKLTALPALHVEYNIVGLLIFKWLQMSCLLNQTIALNHDMRTLPSDAGYTITDTQLTITLFP